jgi:SAM-dependent methyltransferase
MSAPSAEHQTEAGQTVRRLYARRFGSRVDYRDRVWQTLNQHFFSQWIPTGSAVLDLGCGYGEFVNNVQARERFAMDLNPDAELRVRSDATVIIHDCSEPWPLDDQSLDVIFTSNFFEHLPDKQRLSLALAEAFRCLRPGGRLIAMGPNARLVPGQYWDFYDHHIPLTDLSLGEALVDSGFEISKSVAAFLPYTMSSGREYPMWVLRRYLSMPLAWRFVGKQFLIVVERPLADPHP